jgi:hypothetical protein
MNDPRRSWRARSAHEGTEETRRIRQPYPQYVDPAYSGQWSYPPPYYPGSSSNANSNHPTDKLPQYWQHGQPPPDQPPEEPTPRRPKAPRWLWIAAAVAVLLVSALVIALVIANGTARKQSAVPALPAMPSSSNPPSSTPAPRPPSASASAPTSTESSEPGGPSATQTVVYNVNGEGRAISITYVDDDGMMQTEFNVGLPWSKEISLPASANAKASITIINIGHDVTCSLTVDGVEVNERTGVGLTVCNTSS